MPAARTTHRNINVLNRRAHALPNESLVAPIQTANLSKVLTEQEPSPAAAARTSPAIVLLVGPPGTGKTTFARALQQRAGIEILESDVLRRSMFPTPAYDKGESRRVFDLLHESARALLAAGRSVIVDATNLIESERAVLYGIADSSGARCVIVRITAPEAVVRKRLVARTASAGASEAGASAAGVEVFEQMRRIRQPIGRPHFVIDTAASIEPAVEAVAREIKAR